MNQLKRVGLVALVAILLVIVESVGAHRGANLNSIAKPGENHASAQLKPTFVAGRNSVLPINLSAGSIVNPAPPALGNYPASSAALSGNVTINPDVAPTNASSINVSTATDFKGTLSADPVTGVVRVTNAHPAGTYTVTVRAFDNSGTDITKTFTLTVTTSTACVAGFDPIFTNAANVSVGYEVKSIAIGDFNNDGKQDFATGNGGASTLSIRLGNGAGGFNAASNVSVGSDPCSLAIGDFNGDGKQDLAVANCNSSSVSIRLGDGAGGFSGTTELSVGTLPSSVAIGDFNNDGKQDIAVANQQSPTVSIRLGDGLGGFSGTTEVSADTGNLSVAIGDFNNDGKQDLVVAGWHPNNTGVVIRLGDGAGGFGGTTSLNLGWNISVAIGDFNSDGQQDLAVAHGNTSYNVSIRFGDGAGGFTGTTEVAVVEGPDVVAIGDFNNDGKQDVAVASEKTGLMSIRLGDGVGGFNGTTNVSVGYAESIAIGDFNNDGNQDVAAGTADNKPLVTIRLGGCKTAPAIAATAGLSLTQGSLASASPIATVTDDGGSKQRQRVGDRYQRQPIERRDNFQHRQHRRQYHREHRGELRGVKRHLHFAGQRRKFDGDRYFERCGHAEHRAHFDLFKSPNGRVRRGSEHHPDIRK